MRAKEFIREDLGSTVSGNVATVAQPLGAVITRQLTTPATKYANTYKKPWLQRNLKNAR